MCFQCQIPVVFHSTRALSCIRKTIRGKRQKVASEQIVAAALIKNVSVTQLTPQLISFRKGKNDCCKTATTTDRRGSGLMKMILLHYERL